MSDRFGGLVLMTTYLMAGHSSLSEFKHALYHRRDFEWFFITVKIAGKRKNLTSYCTLSNSDNVIDIDEVLIYPSVLRRSLQINKWIHWL